MRTRFRLALAAVAALALLSPGVGCSGSSDAGKADGDKKAGEKKTWEKGTAEGAEHDFGAKVVLVTTRSPDGKGDVGGGFIVKAKVRRLGDRYFVVGQLADMGEGIKESRGTVIWFPLSEIIQLSEYDSVESARRIAAEMRKADKRK